MPNDQTIELLEQHLDGELAGIEADLFQRRLQDEPELEAEFNQLQAARGLRLSAWQSLEQPGVNAETILASLRAKRERRAWFVQILDHREKIAAAAACVAVFMIGWQWGLNSDSYRMIRNGTTTNTQPVNLITQQQLPVAGQQPVFEVQIKDAQGNTLRREQFGSYDDAQRFISKVQKQLEGR